MVKIRANASSKSGTGIGLSSKIGIALSAKVGSNFSRVVNSVFIVEEGIPSGALLTENNKAILTENDQYLIVE